MDPTSAVAPVNTPALAGFALRWSLVAVLVMGVASAAPMSLAQSSGGPYVLVQHAAAGGGARSTGGTVVLTGSIGQADAGRMAGYPYLLDGGFWSGGPPVDALFQDGYE